MMTVYDWAQIRQRYLDGESISSLATEFNITRNTARKYAKSDSAPSYSPRPAPETLLEDHADYIRGRLAAHPLKATRIAKEIRKRGYSGSYSTVQRFVSPITRNRAVKAEIRYETPPGFQTQIDWIDLGKQSQEGLPPHLYCFTAVLGYSRYAYAEFTDNVRTDTLLQCHLNMFDYFGGRTESCLYDNMKSVVLHRALKGQDSQYNPQFEDFSQFHGFAIRLCRPGIEGARTKGKVERFIQFAEGDFIVGQDIESLNDGNMKLREWLCEANNRIHRTTNAVPAERLKEEGLAPLDRARPYVVYYQEGHRIHNDCMVEYGCSWYSAPHQHAGKRCQTRERFGRLEIVLEGEVIAKHELAPRGSKIKGEGHFDGLYAQKRKENLERHQKRIHSTQLAKAARRPVMPEVQVRELAYYEAFAGGNN